MHQLDTKSQHEAATRLGKLLAQDLLQEADVLPPLLEAAVAAGCRGDRSGLQARLSWMLLDAAAEWRQTALLAERDIAKSIRPLFAAWADINDIKAAAFRENERRGDPLLSRAVLAIVDHEADEFMAARARQRRKRNARR